MRQVPTYLLIGNGRLSRHFQHYFNLLGLKVLTWNRQQHTLEQLQTSVQQATHLFVLINDDAIQTFINEHLQQSTAIKMHCSGRLVINDAFGVHPLMTFGKQLYTLNDYQAMPFIVDAHAPAADILLPELPNPQARISVEQKAKYHAMCVMAGNFSCLLWQKLFKTFEQEFQFSRELAYPYLQQQIRNILQHAESALTGPLVRGDVATIADNINALSGDAFQKIYQSFVECYRHEHA